MIQLVREVGGCQELTVELGRGPVIVLQAEDGIRDVAVTGVQTCALPIYSIYPPTPLNGDGNEKGAMRLPSESSKSAIAPNSCGIRPLPPDGVRAARCLPCCPSQGLLQLLAPVSCGLRAQCEQRI